MKESRVLEFKETLSKTFLKTVSAYANHGTGCILFGVDDDGRPVGVEDPASLRLSIENAINDSLDPRPDYFLEDKVEEGNAIVSLTVYEGPDKPYLYGGKAYKRTDTASVPVDRSELRRLSIEGSEHPYDDFDADEQGLSFVALGAHLEAVLGIEEVTDEVLKTLGLLRRGAYNNAAAMVADVNGFPGIDIVRYAADESSIHERLTLEGTSVLTQLDLAIQEFRRHYVVERIEGFARTRHELVPEESFREALANALVHRVWYANARTTVAFHANRIEVVSPGGLPTDMDEELYLNGSISVPRNATLAYVFLRLGLIERLGTGIRRIQKAYGESVAKPSFKIMPQAIRVVLPVVEEGQDLDADEREVLSAFKPGLEVVSADLVAETGLSRSAVLRVLSSLVEKGVLVRIGKARATRYRLA